MMKLRYELCDLCRENDPMKCLSSSRASMDAPLGNPLGPQHLSFVELVVDNGRIKVVPLKGVSDEGKVEWENTLVGRFIGQKLLYSVVNTLAHRLRSDDRLDEVLFAENE